MGMNYYIKFKDRKVNQLDLHIGKSHSGWEFIFKKQDRIDFFNIPSLTTKQEWLEYLFINEHLIVNELDEHVHFLTLIDTINNSKNKNSKSSFENSDNDDCYESEGFTFYDFDFS